MRVHAVRSPTRQPVKSAVKSPPRPGREVSHPASGLAIRHQFEDFLRDPASEATQPGSNAPWPNFFSSSVVQRRLAKAMREEAQAAGERQRGVLPQSALPQRVSALAESDPATSRQVRQRKPRAKTAELGEGQATPRPNGTGLPDALRAGMESLSGLDLSDVRVHTNSDRPARLNALAYAQGNHIHLGAGQERHLPHEAWHVVQQRQGRVRPTMQMKGGVGINADDGLEREAEMMGTKALQAKGRKGRKAAKGAVHQPVVQRVGGIVTHLQAALDKLGEFEKKTRAIRGKAHDIGKGLYAAYKPIDMTISQAEKKAGGQQPGAQDLGKKPATENKGESENNSSSAQTPNENREDFVIEGRRWDSIRKDEMNKKGKKGKKGKKDKKGKEAGLISKLHAMRNAVGFETWAKTAVVSGERIFRELEAVRNLSKRLGMKPYEITMGVNTKTEPDAFVGEAAVEVKFVSSESLDKVETNIGKAIVQLLDREDHPLQRDIGRRIADVFIASEDNPWPYTPKEDRSKVKIRDKARARLEKIRTKYKIDRPITLYVRTPKLGTFKVTFPGDESPPVVESPTNSPVTPAESQSNPNQDSPSTPYQAPKTRR